MAAAGDQQYSAPVRAALGAVAEAARMDDFFRKNDFRETGLRCGRESTGNRGETGESEGREGRKGREERGERFLFGTASKNILLALSTHVLMCLLCVLLIISL